MPIVKIDTIVILKWGEGRFILKVFFWNISFQLTLFLLLKK